MGKGLIINEDVWVLLDGFEPEECRELITCLAAFHRGEDVPQMSRVVGFAYQRIALDNGRFDPQKRAELSAKRAEAGRIGGSKPKQNKQTEANESKSSKPLQEEKRIEENRIEKNRYNTPSNGFAEAWALYPKKQGRKEAEAAYLRAIRDGTSHETIVNGIKAYADYIKRNGTEMRYVKQGSTFFRQNAWNDDWSQGKTITMADYKSQLQKIDYSALLRK